MSDSDLIRLICKLLDVAERRLIPWSMQFAGALCVGVRSLPEKFRFCPPVGQSFLVNVATLRPFQAPVLWLSGKFCRISNGRSFQSCPA